MDIYKVYWPDATSRDCVWFGRCSMVAMMFFGVLWIPVLEWSTQEHDFPFFVIIQTISSSIAPTLSAVVILGLTVPRVNSQGAFVGLIVGVALGTIRLVLVFVFNGTCSDDP